MSKITDVSPYFKFEKNQWIFTGKELKVYIPEVYQGRNLLSIGNTASSLGVLQLRINGKYEATLLLLNKIEIEFESDSKVTEHEYEYIVLNVLPGQALIRNTRLVKDPGSIYNIFMTFVALGKLPPFLDYDATQSIFDNDRLVCGASLGVNHSIWEMVFAHMHRDKEDPYTFYRYTKMDKEPQIVSLHAISHGPQSTSAKVIGGYMSDGLVSALVDKSEKESSLIENMLR